MPTSCFQHPCAFIWLKRSTRQVPSANPGSFCWLFQNHSFYIHHQFLSSGLVSPNLETAAKEMKLFRILICHRHPLLSLPTSSVLPQQCRLSEVGTCWNTSRNAQFDGRPGTHPTARITVHFLETPETPLTFSDMSLWPSGSHACHLRYFWCALASALFVVGYRADVELQMTPGERGTQSDGESGKAGKCLELNLTE